MKLFRQSHFSLARPRRFLTPPSIRDTDTASDRNTLLGLHSQSPNPERKPFFFLKLSALITIQAVYERRQGPCSKAGFQGLHRIWHCLKAFTKHCLTLQPSALKLEVNHPCTSFSKEKKDLNLLACVGQLSIGSIKRN